MASRCMAALFVALMLLLGLGGTARAQNAYVNGYAGVFIPSDSELEGLVTIDPGLLLGGALGYALTPSWELSGVYGFSSVTATIEEAGPDFGEEEDAKVHLYYGALSYVAPTERTLQFLGTVGVGGMRVSLEIDPAESSNDLMVNFGAGLRWKSGDRFAFQAVARDHVQFCKGSEGEDKVSLCPLDDATLHHIEISGGVLILF